MAAIRYEPELGAVLQNLAKSMAKMTYGELTECQENFSEGMRRAAGNKRTLCKDIADEYLEHPRRWSKEKQHTLETFAAFFPTDILVPEIQAVLNTVHVAEEKASQERALRVKTLQPMLADIRGVLSKSQAYQAQFWIGDTSTHEKRCERLGLLYASAFTTAGVTWADYVSGTLPLQGDERSWFKSLMASNPFLTSGEDSETGIRASAQEASFIQSLLQAGAFDLPSVKKQVLEMDRAFHAWIKSSKDAQSLARSKELAERLH